MANTFIARDLKKSQSFITKDGRELEGINYRQLKAGIQPISSEPVVEQLEVLPETIEEKRARLRAELDALK